eukprot:766099-Hanusia_phi.AAC.6
MVDAQNDAQNGKESLCSLLEVHHLERSDFDQDDWFYLEKIFRVNEQFAVKFITKAIKGSECKKQQVAEISTRIKSFARLEAQQGDGAQGKWIDNVR